MKKYLSILITTLIFACGSGKEANESADSTDVAILNEVPVIKIIQFDSLAANYVDKEVQIKGIVDHVCKHGGKRLFLVDNGAELHIESDERFNDSLMGNEILVTGIVREFRVDEGYCLKMDEDNIKSHSEGQSNKEQFEHKKRQIAAYRDSMKLANTDHLSFYSLDYVSHK